MEDSVGIIARFERLRKNGRWQRRRGGSRCDPADFIPEVLREPNVAVRPNRHSGRFADGMVGRVPAAEEMALAVEDLDSGRHIDDVEMIFPVDGHRPGLLQSTIGDAASPPYRLQPPGGSPVAVATLYGGSQAGNEDNPKGPLWTAVEHDARGPTMVRLIIPSAYPVCEVDTRCWLACFLCHCLEQAVPEQRVTPGTASAKQWHTVGHLHRVVRNAG